MEKSKKNIAVVTGASSGLGRQFVITIAEKYQELDEIWIVARRKERLQKLAEQIEKPLLRPLVFDLTDTESFVKLNSIIEKERPTVKILVNNAGYVKTGYFKDISRETVVNMLDLNIVALTKLQHLILPYMESGSFTIMTSSACSFAPIVGQAVYSAGKKYVYNLGRALKEELKPFGINVLVLCCGNMDTEMNPQEKAREVSAFLPFLDLHKLTANALEKAAQGYGVYTMGKTYKLLRVIGKMLPSSIIMKITKKYFP